MTTIKLTLNEKTSKGQKLLAYIKEIAYSDNSIVIENINEPNKETLKALKDAELGKVTTIDNIEDLFNSI